MQTQNTIEYFPSIPTEHHHANAHHLGQHRQHRRIHARCRCTAPRPLPDLRPGRAPTNRQTRPTMRATPAQNRYCRQQRFGPETPTPHPAHITRHPNPVRRTSPDGRGHRARSYRRDVCHCRCCRPAFRPCRRTARQDHLSGQQRNAGGGRQPVYGNRSKIRRARPTHRQ